MSRVVVTGMGAVTPIGNDVDSFLEIYLPQRLGSPQLQNLMQNPLESPSPVK